MQDNSRYADTAQAREVEAGARDCGYDPFHPDNPDLTEYPALKQRQQAEDESRRARMSIAMGQLEEFFGASEHGKESAVSSGFWCKSR